MVVWAVFSPQINVKCLLLGEDCVIFCFLGCLVGWFFLKSVDLD